jgi:PAS domain S-box-containing protein
MSDRIKLIIVEDNPSDAELLLHALQRSDFEPDWQRVDNEAAYLSLLKGDVDIILADYSLPQFNALRALHMLQAQQLDIPLIVVTGTVTEEVAIACMREGAADYLLKDRLTRLGEAVRRALDQKHLRDAKRIADERLRLHAEELEQLVDERTRELLNAKEHVEAILNNTSDAIVLATEDGVIEQINPALVGLIPRTAVQAVGTMLWSLASPDYQAVVREAVEILLRDRRTIRLEVQVEADDGALLDIDLSLDLIFQRGAVKGIVASLRDVTERRRAERALNQSEARYRRLAENAQDIIFHYRVLPTRGLEYLNPATETVLGYSPEEFYADPVIADRLIHPGDHHEMVEVPTSGQSEDAATPVVFRWVRRDGDEIFLEMRTVPIFDATGNLVAIEGIGRDVTEQSRREEELRALLARERELNELKQRFVSMVSHEFRTPLSMIQVSSDLLKLYGERLGPQQRVERLQTIQSQVKHLVTLLDDILALSRAEAFGFDFTPTWTNLQTLCSAIVGEMQTMAATHTFDLITTGDCHWLNVDVKLIKQALSNLLSNAIKYSAEGTRITVELACDSATASIRVRDQGIGIPPEDLTHMFEVFHRAQNVGSIPGTGLGLPIVRQAVQAHGGDVAVESEVGVGTVFTMTIPVTNGSEETAP